MIKKALKDNKKGGIIRLAKLTVVRHQTDHGGWMDGWMGRWVIK